MFTKKEITWALIVMIIFAFIIGFSSEFSPISFIISFLVISVSLTSKKIAAKYFFVDIEHQIWKFQRYGFMKRAYFKKPFPMGIVLPFLMTVLSLGLIRPLTFFELKCKASKMRILRSRGTIHRTLEVKESDLGWICAYGFWGLWLLAFTASYLQIDILAQYAVYYGVWNLLPISNLDGTKIFFGSFFNWALLSIVYLVSLIIVLI